METWLSEVNEALLFVGLLAFLVAAAEIGFQLAARARRACGDVSPHASSIQGAVLGLLALLLGFTFSLAMSRFEARKQILRDEANAIGTTYLRARLLPDPMRSRLLAQLRGYVDTRFELGQASIAAERVRQVHARASILHEQMWTQVEAAVAAQVEPELVSLFAAALNDAIDMHGVRLAAIRNRVPLTIFALLFLVALAALGLTGYASGPERGQSAALNALVALLVAMVMLLTLDLHRPTRGLIVLDMTGMQELRESMR